MSSVEKCWAASLGNCRGKLSKEHPISACIFSDDLLSVESPLWVGPRRLGKPTIAARILCEHHNHELAPLDSIAGRLSGAVRDLYRLKKSQILDIDGWFYERYHVKALIGLCSSGWAGGKLGHCDPTFVEVAFGTRRLERGAGLYAINVERGRDNDADKVRWGLLTSSNDPADVCGLFLSVHSLSSIATIKAGDPHALVQGMGQTGAFDFTGVRLTYRPRALSYFIQETGARLEITLSWS